MLNRLLNIFKTRNIQPKWRQQIMDINLKELHKTKHPLNKGSLATFKAIESTTTGQKSDGRLWSYLIQASPLAFQMMDDEKDPIFLGFEWESHIKGPDSVLRDVVKEAMDTPLRYLTNFRCGGNPLELVSIPATASFHKEYMESEFFGRGFDKMLNNPKGINSCGIHIHVCKTAFNEETLRKFTTFIINQANGSFITDLVDRDMRDPSVGYYKPNLGNLKYHQTSRLKGRLSGSDICYNKDLVQVNPNKKTNYICTGKSWAVNSETSRGTIEVRIFNTTNSKQKFYKNLEFVEALIRFVREAEYESLYAQDFAKYVAKNKDMYPNLYIDSSLAEYLPKVAVRKKA